MLSSNYLLHQYAFYFRDVAHVVFWNKIQASLTKIFNIHISLIINTAGGCGIEGNYIFLKAGSCW